jgi:hypothetical protein
LDLPNARLYNAAPKKTRNPRLLEGIRIVAAGYQWPFETFRHVLEALWHSRTIDDDEFFWLLDGGPATHPYRDQYPHGVPGWRGLPDGTAEEQYKTYRRLARRERRRFVARSARKKS